MRRLAGINLLFVRHSTSLGRAKVCVCVWRNFGPLVRDRGSFKIPYFSVGKTYYTSVTGFANSSRKSSLDSRLFAAIPPRSGGRPWSALPSSINGVSDQNLHFYTFMSGCSLKRFALPWYIEAQCPYLAAPRSALTTTIWNTHVCRYNGLRAYY